MDVDLTPLTEVVMTNAQQVISDRRLLHMRPELSFEEYDTTGLIREVMGELGAEDVCCPTPTGGVFVIEGAHPGRAVLLRADIDALPVHEAVDVPFRSSIDGCMHACGHDAHTAMLLGVARAMSAAARSLPGRYVFVFQPGEERFSGARAMLDGGLLDVAPADVALACHVISLMPAGVVAVRGGLMFSDGKWFRLTLRGAGGHGALAGVRGNPLAAAARLILELPSVVEGLATEGTACACSAGMLYSGTAPNIIASEATVEGTLRTFTDQQKAEALERLDGLVTRLAVEHDVGFEVEFPVHAPAVFNDEHATLTLLETARALLGAGRVRIPSGPFTPSDDMSEILERVPGVYFSLGAALPDHDGAMHHSPTFAIDDRVLPDGCLVLAATAARLARHTTD
jgi:amidohydrolase